LADVDALVGAGEVEQARIAAEDDVAEGHGGGAAAEQGAVSEEQRDEPAVQLQDAVHDVRAAVAGEQGEGEEQQPGRAGR
jgi:hypothetical protein